jgi:hypothetical protein
MATRAAAMPAPRLSPSADMPCWMLPAHAGVLHDHRTAHRKPPWSQTFPATLYAEHTKFWLLGATGSLLPVLFARTGGQAPRRRGQAASGTQTDSRARGPKSWYNLYIGGLLSMISYAFVVSRTEAGVHSKLTR